MKLRDEINALIPGLRRFAQALVACDDHAGEAQAEEFAYEAVVRALRFDRPAPGISVRIWLYGLLISLYRCWLSKHGEIRHHGAHVFNTHFTRPDDQDRRQPIAEALGHLAPEERAALLLVVLEGFSYTHAAVTLGIPRAIFIARLAGARARLSVSLNECAPSTPVYQAPSFRSFANASARSHLRVIK